MNKNKKLTYAMIGGAMNSFIGPVHRECIRLDNLADIVAGCFSRSEKNNRGTAEFLGIDKKRVYSNWKELIDAEKGKIDFLIVATPNNSHYEIAKAAMLAGMDVVCEKPLSLSLKEAIELEKLVKSKHRMLAIPFTYTGNPMVKLARDLVARGDLGSVCKIVLEYQQGSFRKIDFGKHLDKHNSWKMDPKIAGPSCVIADIGVHAFNLIEYVTGLEVKSVLADLSSFAPGNKLDDDGSVLMRLAEGAKASLVTSKVATGEENGVRLRVYGDKASLYWNQENPNELVVKYPLAPDQIYKRNAPYIKEISAASIRSSRTPAGHPEGFIGAFANIFHEFCDSLVTRKAGDFPSAHEGVRSMKFVEAVLESNRKGNRWVRI